MVMEFINTPTVHSMKEAGTAIKYKDKEHALTLMGIDIQVRIIASDDLF